MVKEDILTSSIFFLAHKFSKYCLGPKFLSYFDDGFISESDSLFSLYDRNSDTKRATWKLNDLSELSENGSHGSIRAKFALGQEGSKSTPSSTAIQFLSEGSTLSGIDFELVGQGYRISLAKKRFGAGMFVYTFNLCHTILSFNKPEEEAFLRQLWEKEKMLVTSIFSFSHVFFLFQHIFNYQNHTEIVASKGFQFAPA